MVKWEYAKAQYQLNITYSKNKTGQVRINRRIGHNRNALRIFDENNQFVWENLNNVSGIVRPAVIDIDEDGLDEIIIYKNDHGQNYILIFSSKKKPN